MPSFQELLVAPWLLEQKGAGNCGFTAVIIHLARTRDLFLGVLHNYVTHSHMPDSAMYHMHAAIQRRKLFNFPRSNDEAWYLALALTIYFKRHCNPVIFRSCIEFSETISPRWRYGGKLKSALTAMRDHPEIHLSDARNELDFTYKSGTLALNLNGMLSLLAMSGLKLRNKIVLDCWERVPEDILPYALYKRSELSPEEFMIKRWLVKEIWEKEFFEQLMALPANCGIIIGWTYFRGTETDRFFTESGELYFTHWSYCVKLPNGIIEEWEDREKELIKANEFIVVENDVEKMLRLPRIVLPLLAKTSGVGNF